MPLSLSRRSTVNTVDCPNRFRSRIFSKISLEVAWPISQMTSRTSISRGPRPFARVAPIGFATPKPSAANCLPSLPAIFCLIARTATPTCTLINLRRSIASDSIRVKPFQQLHALPRANITPPRGWKTSWHRPGPPLDLRHDRLKLEGSRKMPEGELRRKDRETSRTYVQDCLDRALVGRVGTVGPDGGPYVVPMNLVFDPASKRVYLHCANTGHLLDNLAGNDRVCFEVDEPGELLATGPAGCDTSQAFQSVICFGRAHIVTGSTERD